MSHHETTIDDLLRHEDDPQRVVRADATSVWLFKTAFLCAAGAGVVLLVLRVLGFAVPYPLLLALALAGALLRRALAAVEAPPLPAELTGRPRPERHALDPDAPDDGVATAMARWDRRLEWTHRDAVRFSNTVRAQIADMVDERLRLRHGVTRDTDPDRARAILGEQLWVFLHEPLRRSPSPRELSALVARMEAL